MKIQHLNTLLQGGAATAARRLHESLLQIGVDSRFRYSERESPDAELGDSYEEMRWEKQSLYQRAQSSIGFRIHRQQFKKVINRRGGGHEIFTSPKGQPQTVIRAESNAQDQILHLHWIAKLIDYQSFFGSIDADQPIVWTLHDMNAFTGGCHFSDGCQNFLNGCGNCHQLLVPRENDFSRSAFLKKRMALLGKNLHIAAPSRWLIETARSSPMFDSEVKFHHIPYGIDTDAFYPMDRADARARLGIANDAQVICFGAADVKAIRKGGRQLLVALHAISDLPNLVCLVFGAGQLPETSGSLPPIHHVGSISGTLEQRTVMSAADLFVLPSLEDNLPLTGLEAMACGTPIVGFDAGGIPDYVRPGVSGWLAKTGDAEDLASSLRVALESQSNIKRLSRSARQMIEQEYPRTREAEAYRDLYAALLEVSESDVAESDVVKLDVKGGRSKAA